MAEEVIPPLLSVEEANSPDKPDSDCVEKQEEQMGIFQTLDRLEEAVDAILKTKSAASSSTLQQNLKAMNTKKLNHCTICTKSFAKLETLKIHMRVHTGEKPCFCHQCAKSFSQSSHLRSHLRVHTGEKTHTCPQCTKSFSQLSNLRSHLRVHTGEKTPYLPSVYKVIFTINLFALTYKSSHW
jgi:uncharacterized Zn-finger protein